MKFQQQITQLNDLVDLVSYYDNNIKNLEEKIKNLDYQIKKIDDEINLVLNNLSEGKLARLRILQEIKHNLISGLSEIFTEHRELLKSKSDIYKFVVKLSVENKINETTNTGSEITVFEIIRLLDNFQRRNKEYSNVVKEISNEIQNLLNLKSETKTNNYDIDNE